MNAQCLYCGGPNDILRTGRVPKYCSDRCRLAAHRRRHGVRTRTELLADPEYRANLSAGQRRRHER